MDMKINDIKNYIKKVYYSGYIDNKMVKGNDMATYYCINREGLNWFKKNHERINNSISKIIKLQRKLKKYCKNNIKTKLNRSPKFNKLKEWRKEKAKEINKPPYCIFKNSILEDIILKKPRTKKDLQKIKGIGPKKILQYGDDVMSIIN